MWGDPHHAASVSSQLAREFAPRARAAERGQRSGERMQVQSEAESVEDEDDENFLEACHLDSSARCFELLGAIQSKQKSCL